MYACKIENLIRFKHNLSLRTHYAYYSFDTADFYLPHSDGNYMFTNQLTFFGKCCLKGQTCVNQLNRYDMTQISCYSILSPIVLLNSAMNR